ncbi:E3 ubiquitin-protein ligase rnf8-A-like isoform X2 [Tiliqua scincoides]|uniref:E3 ubiquitin-protein ligase rnf8-A-like isoform X2 n=1 Tax=Tiliqua scincoides TaxID=71010 RepID=UPI00346194D1
MSPRADASGEEILSALTLAEKVRGVAKRVAPTHWDPTQETQKRRAAIGALRSQLFSSSHLEQDNMISQLGKALKELQVLRSQRWEKKKEASAAYEVKEDMGLEARSQIPSEMDVGNELGNQLGSHMSQDDTQQDKEISGDSSSKVHPGQVDVHEGATEKTLFTSAASRASDLNGTTQAPSPHEVDQQHQDTKVRFSLAKARRQCLQEQHRLLIQQELLKMEEELAGQEKLLPNQQEALRWQKERALLTFRLEALQREQLEAERDLEELYQEHRQEAEAQKQHILQVFQAYRKHAEEQMSALERKYRKLLQESLQDAIILSSQNQQLRVQKQLGCIERATQTDFPPLKQSQESHSPS